MTFDEILTQAIELLQREGRVSYRALKRRFSLDDEYLGDLKAEIIDAKRLAVDEDGKVLVWTGASLVSGSTFQVSGFQPPTPSTQTLDARHQTLDSSRPEAERRQLTVMFCDLVDSTVLSEKLDPEEWRAVVQGYHTACAEVTRRFEGRIAQYLGDGLLVYFGYPVAHEDDAQRAARVGLEIVASLPRLNAQVKSIIEAHGCAPLRVRIGIHTGLVVVGEVGDSSKREQLALGETPNLAARLQGLAEPDTVVMSTVTYQLVAGFFECQDLGLQALKGISTPMQVYRLVGESGVRSRLEVAATRGLTPLVGREEEVSLLLRRWELTTGGDGQVVLLRGEAGIGKSRLVQVLKDHLANIPYTRIECHCSPYYQNSALYPVIDHLQRLLQVSGEESSQAKALKLEAALARVGMPLPEAMPLFATLLSLSTPRFPSPILTPQRQKQKTLDTLQTWLLKEAEQQPVLLVVEDLHWIDPSTLEFLSLLIEQISASRVLIVLTFRPDFHPPWTMLSHLTQLTLSRLARKQVEVMVERIASGQTLARDLLQQIVTKTDGVPLFVEEVTKTVVESRMFVEIPHAASLPSLGIPTTLHDALMARLDRLETAKDVAQLGATLGREFSYELVQAISPTDEGSLQQALAKLVEAELLFQRGQPPQARYIFKHALIQDAAYQSLLKSTRQQYHQQIAHVLEERFPESKGTQPELLAHHYTEAGFVERAIPYWQRAGQRAVERSANEEAIGHFTKALELLKTLPDTPERAQQELTLQIGLGPALMAVKGYATPEVEETYTRARELCQQVGDTPQLLPVLVALWVVYIQRGHLQTARELGEQCLSLAQRVQDPALLLQAHIVLGITLFHVGELTSARTHLEEGLVLYDPHEHHSLTFFYYGLDPGMFCLSWAALTLWNLGYPDQALRRSQEALTLATRLSHPFSMAYAQNWAAWLQQLLWQRQTVQEQAEAAVSLSTEQEFPFYAAWGTIMRGWALAEQGQGAEGIARMRQGLASLRDIGAELWRPYHLSLLAEAYRKVGQAEEGLTVLSEALAMVHETGVRMWEAELYRLKGQLTLQKFQVSGSRFQVQENQKPVMPALRLGSGQAPAGIQGWGLGMSSSIPKELSRWIIESLKVCHSSPFCNKARISFRRSAFQSCIKVCR